MTEEERAPKKLKVEQEEETYDSPPQVAQHVLPSIGSFNFEQGGGGNSSALNGVPRLPSISLLHQSSLPASSSGNGTVYEGQQPQTAVVAQSQDALRNASAVPAAVDFRMYPGVNTPPRVTMPSMPMGSMMGQDVKLEMNSPNRLDPVVATLIRPPVPLNMKPNLGLSINVQPAKFQIANYNIQPLPSLICDNSLTTDVTVTALLIENIHRTEIAKGFKAGDIQVMRTNSRIVIFHGLKLNKMGHLKSELTRVNLRPRDCTFCVRFSVGNTYYDSEPFRIVSSYSQLPTDEQTKRQSTSKKGSDKSPPTTPPKTYSPPQIPQAVNYVTGAEGVIPQMAQPVAMGSPTGALEYLVAATTSRAQQQQSNPYDNV